MPGQVFTSRVTRGGGFMVSEAEHFRSRSEIVVAEGEVLLAGAVLGKITAGSASAAAKAGGNTGGGTITASPVLEVDAVEGVYHLVCIGGTFSVSRAAHAGNTGTGVMTLASPAFASTVEAGVWRVVCTTEAGGGGTFSIFNPSGDFVDEVDVGTPYDGDIKFTIADGTPDFINGDSILVTVVHAVASNSGVFSVTGPDGEVLPNATVGTPYTDQLDFTITDVGTDFIVGDGFNITVVLDAAQYKEWNPGNDDGSEVVAGVLWDDIDATDGPVKGAAITQAAQVNGGELTWFSGATTGNKVSGAAGLEALGIRVRPSVPA